jgi:hypothetical protein
VASWEERSKPTNQEFSKNPRLPVNRGFFVFAGYHQNQKTNKEIKKRKKKDKNEEI